MYSNKNHYHFMKRTSILVSMKKKSFVILIVILFQFISIIFIENKMKFLNKFKRSLESNKTYK